MKKTISLPVAALILLPLASACGGPTYGGYVGDECQERPGWTYEDPGCTSQLWCLDRDGDGVAGRDGCEQRCDAPGPQWTTEDGDCDDSWAALAPGAEERCDGLDQDCDGFVDEGAPDGRLWYADQDLDGHGDAASTRTACAQPQGYAALGDDCDDADAFTHPGASERPDGEDDDCDGLADEGLADADLDGDGVSAADGDCDDQDPQRHPGADEVCGGGDEDCDGLTDDEDPDLVGAPTWMPDADGDGAPAPGGEGLIACEPPAEGYGDGEADCDDGDPAVYPGAPERWGDDKDDDCDGLAPAADAYVSPSGGWVADGQEAPVFSTVQAALDGAAPGLVIAVEPGTYKENLDFGGAQVHLKSMAGPEVTILDGRGTGSVLVFTNGEGPEAIVEGFTLTRGVGTDGDRCGLSPGFRYGGAVCVNSASPTLIGNHILGNSVTGSGGGIYVEDGSPILTGNLISGNEALYDGGGVNLSRSAATVEGGRVEGNRADRSGGGLVLNAFTGALSHLVVSGNEAGGLLAPPLPARGPLGGGGIVVTGGGAPALSYVVIAGNRSGSDGGGVQLYQDPREEGAPASLSLVHGVIAANAAEGAGGGFASSGGALSLSGTVVEGNAAEDGAPGGMMEGGASLSSAYSLYLNGAAHGLVGAAPGEDDIVASAGLLDPGAALPDVHLSAGSAAVDAGDPEEADAHGGPADIGAYGGPGGGGWDLDGDGLPAHPWPGAAADAPPDIDPQGFDCDDADALTGACGEP